MRYLVSIAGVFGFLLVLAVGLLLEKPLPLALVTALMAAAGFALLCQWWTQLILMSYRQALSAAPAPLPPPATTTDSPTMTEPPNPLATRPRASRRR